jgi:hypothetical protein
MNKNSTAISAKNNQALQTQLNTLVSSMNKILENFIPILNLEFDKTILLGNSMYSVEIRRSNPYSLVTQSSYESDYNLATYNVDKCVSILQKSENITGNLIIAKIEKNSNLNLDNINNSYPTNLVNVNFYNPITFKKLNNTLCNATVSFGFPLKNASAMNMTKYRQLKDDGIEMYDSKDPSYSNICNTYVDKDTNFDTTVNSRRTMYYQGRDGTCLGSCNYTGIANDTRVQCNCTGLATGVDYGSDFKTNTLPEDKVLISNIQISACTNLIGVIFTFIN